VSLLSEMRQRAIRVLAARYADHCVRLNQVQVLGSHNSYHIQPPPELIDFYVLSDPRAIQWEYTHAPLDEQFEYEGIRQIELDVYADPLGGLYSQPFALFRVSGNDPNARFEELDAPGLKVHHVVDLDVFTTCSIFVECLELVKAWSDAHPGHLPIMILVETKDEAALITLPPLFEGPEFDQLDMEIRSVFPPEQLITPDDVRGDLPTCRPSRRPFSPGAGPPWPSPAVACSSRWTMAASGSSIWRAIRPCAVGYSSPTAFRASPTRRSSR
jgi:hypothetical protein